MNNMSSLKSVVKLMQPMEVKVAKRKQTPQSCQALIKKKIIK
jgi:hypothetical protein